MHFDTRASLALHKTNLGLYLRLCTLLRENSLRWINASTHSIDTCSAEFETVIGRMLAADNWTAMLLAAGEMPWKTAQHQVDAVQHLAETMLGSQAAFMSATQEALSTWQRDAAVALRETTGAMPLSTTLRSLIEDYLPSVSS
ncbi:hypothetical protein [Aromatoleum bremense]|uniref:Phasin domain-containing protein n=1 Tax=Aromatoleum bremense TaxID=76115 RepID=A0ABX1NRU5_9RHOO|nr:hypothetical protein [Aromatoleum bremense]NMG14622.1 hypothetical protein [Aromatoleum bremense]QTQ30532.1 Uncharacterized protein pbN1_05400 [Aromatoleum bremense]